MRRHAKASSAGSTDGTGSSRGLFRRAFATRGASSGSKGSGAPSLRRRQPVLIACLAVIASLTVGVGAAAAAGPPIITIDPVTTSAYTTAHVSGTVDMNGMPYGFWAFQYSSDPATEGWKNGPSLPGGPFNNSVEQAGPHSVADDLTGLKTGTTYQVRLAAVNYYEGDASKYFSPEPNPTFTTEPVASQSVTLDPITTFDASTAHFSGTVDAHVPAGPLSPAGEAAYRTEWKFVCTPDCLNPAGNPYGGVINADESSAAVSADVIRLEANTAYEVKLVAVNAGGTTVATQNFHTSLVAPSVKAEPGASDGKGGYTLQGVVNPFNSKVTDCHFEYGPTAAYVYVAPCSPMPVGRNEVQRIEVPGQQGQYRLTFRGQTTGDLAYNASSAVVEAELEALSSIGPNGVSVEEELSFETVTHIVTFTGPLAETNVPSFSGEPGTDPIEIGGTPSQIRYITRDQGGNNLPILVEAPLTGLTIGATYHFQVVATNGGGTQSSGDRIFVPTLAPPRDACPNDGVRTESNSLALPECRAYEMVSPPIKNGYFAELLDYSDDGSAVSYQTLAGNLSNSGSGGVFGKYTTVRKDDGWETIPNLNGPSQSPYSGPEAVFSGTNAGSTFSADLRTSIWYQGRAGEANNVSDVYKREPDGRFVFVGPGLDKELEPTPPANTSDTALSPGYWNVASSADLSHLLYNGTSGYGNIYGPGVYEFVGTGNDAPRRVDVDNSGDPISGCVGFGQNAGHAHGNSMSTDGSVIYFTAHGGCPSGPAADEIWARVDGTTSYDASQSHCTRTVSDIGGVCNAPADAHFEGAASDGSRVFFTTTQQLVNGDTDETKDLYAYSVPTASNPSPSPALVEVSGARSEAEVDEIARISDDGSTVYFVASGVLADNDGPLGEPAVREDHNLYVWRGEPNDSVGETKFVTRLASKDIYYPYIYTPQTTPSGGDLVFTTGTRITESDTDNARDVFRYDADTGEMTRVSVNIAGLGGNADGFDSATFNLFFGRHSHGAISDDGSAIVFTTKEALSPADGNGVFDAYLWRNGHVFLVSTGSVGGEAEKAFISGSGKDILFTTVQPISPDDTDLVADVYDARIGGGFSSAEAARCAGEGCQPSKAGPASTPALATDHPNGTGNVKGGTVSVKPLAASDRKKLSSGGKAGLKLKVSGPGKISVKGMARIGGKQKQVFAGSLTAKKAGIVKVPISLSKEAQAQLRKDGSLAVQVSVSFSGGTSATSKLKLKASGAKPGHSKRRDG